MSTAVETCVRKDPEIRFAALAGTLTKLQLKRRVAANLGVDPETASPLEPFGIAFEDAMFLAVRAARREDEDDYDSLNEELVGDGEEKRIYEAYDTRDFDNQI